ncbi:aminoacetone oxidase family FAD-binding enzyme [bacterium]|nr:aminoacetone oxidase family FAD-binding enzyme [bacterium]
MSDSIAIIGAGPAGCMTACNLDKSFDTTLFDKNSPLKTLLPTGGGKCNLAHKEFDFKELAKNYPRGEKFLYSIFSKFSTQDTLDFFEQIGVKTYTREDNRIFPISNSSKEVREKLLAKLHNCKFRKEEITLIKPISNGFEVKSDKATYLFDKVVIATGGKCNYSIIKNLGHTIEKPCPSLVGLKTNPYFKGIQGVTLKNCKITANKKTYFGDILFTDNGITGPIIFEISSINAKNKFPYKININFLNTDINFQKEFEKNAKKDLKNVLYEYLPKSFINEFFKTKSINLNEKCYNIKKETRETIKDTLTNFEFEITGTRPDGETVTCGGVKLMEINPQTLESKIVRGLYFCGEVLDIDGFCGGFNLQNCWSTGYIAANSINNL